jgi:hypothetical protein
MPTDRELLFTLIDAIGALSERLTGERLVIRVSADEGESTDMYASAQNYRWEKINNAFSSQEQSTQAACERKIALVPQERVPSTPL